MQPKQKGLRLTIHSFIHKNASGCHRGNFSSHPVTIRALSTNYPSHAKEKSDMISFVPLFFKTSYMFQIALAHLRQHRVAVGAPDRLVEDLDLDRPSVAG